MFKGVEFNLLFFIHNFAALKLVIFDILYYIL